MDDFPNTPIVGDRSWFRERRQPGSSLPPVATIRSDPSGNGRCGALASSHGARIQTSCSSGVVRMTGIAFGCTRPTSEFGSVVRNAKMSAVTSPSFAFRTLVQLVHSPAKHSSGRLSSEANQTGTFLPSMVSYSENDVNGTRQRLSGPSQRFQCALATFLMFVVPLSGSMRKSCLKSTD